MIRLPSPLNPTDPAHQEAALRFMRDQFAGGDVAVAQLREGISKIGVDKALEAARRVVNMTPFVDGVYEAAARKIDRDLKTESN